MVIMSLSFRRTVYPTLYCENIDNPNGNLQLQEHGTTRIAVGAGTFWVYSNIALGAGRTLQDGSANVLLNPDDAGGITSLANVASATTFNSKSVRDPYLYGAGNAENVPCIFFGETRGYGHTVDSTPIHLHRGGTNSPYFAFLVPLPTVAYGKDLYLGDVRLALSDADASDKITACYIMGSNAGAGGIIQQSSDDKQATGFQVYSFAPARADAYEMAYVYIYTTTAAAEELKINGVTVEAYYA